MSNSPSSSRILHLEVQHSVSLSEALMAYIPQMTIEKAHFLIEFGAIYIDNYRVMTDEKVKIGQMIRAHINPRRFPAHTVDWDAAIIDEDRDFLIVNKPQGFPVHPTLDNAREDVLSALIAHRKQELYITQRLDVGTGGLFCIAKTKEFQRHFNRWLAERKIEKFYLAATRNPAKLGLMTHYMLPGDRAPRLVQLEADPALSECRMEILTADPIELDPKTIVYAQKIHLLTGRTHQIRTQLAFENSPLIGDQLYIQVYRQLKAGLQVEKPDPRTLIDERFGLWCTNLKFNNRQWELPFPPSEQLRLFRDINAILPQT